MKKFFTFLLSRELSVTMTVILFLLMAINFFRIQTGMLEVLRDVSLLSETNQAQTKILERRIGSLEITLAKTSSTARTDIKVKTLNSEIDSMKSRVNRLENAVIQEPEKTLALPLLKKDVENLKGTSEQNIQGLRREMSSGFDAVKLVIGILSAILLLAIGKLIGERPKKPQEELKS